MDSTIHYSHLLEAESGLPFPPLAGKQTSLPAITSSVERARTYRGLDAAVRNGLHIPELSLRHDRYIIFSDLHRGSGQKHVDEFLHNRDLYCQVLGHYLASDYRLVLNGDVEEGWKADYRRITQAYRHSALAAEREFAARSGFHYIRIYGNHDDALADPRFVKRHLSPHYGAVSVYPAVVIGQRIVVAHGHQGDFYSDRYSWLSRKIVRHIWRPVQSLTGISIGGETGNRARLSTRDGHLAAWARDNRALLICGHTHRAHFPAAPSALNYLNDGACIHSDGMTGIEIEGGEIRLVMWRLSPPSGSAASGGDTGEQAVPDRRVLQSRDLGRILHANEHARYN